MDWPNFEHTPLKADGFLRNKLTGVKTQVFTMATWHREHGKNFFKELVQFLPEDLDEGPDFNSLEQKDEDDINDGT